MWLAAFAVSSQRNFWHSSIDISTCDRQPIEDRSKHGWALLTHHIVFLLFHSLLSATKVDQYLSLNGQNGEFFATVFFILSTFEKSNGNLWRAWSFHTSSAIFVLLEAVKSKGFTLQRTVLPIYWLWRSWPVSHRSSSLSGVGPKYCIFKLKSACIKIDGVRQSRDR